MFTIKHVYQSLKMKMQKGRCKHIDVKYINLFKKKMKENKIKLQQVRTENMLANPLIKPITDIKNMERFNNFIFSH